MNDLDNFLAQCREGKRAFAVKLDLLGYSSAVIEDLLQVSASCIRKWRIHYQKYGIHRVYLQYQGSRGHLSPQERAEVIDFLSTKDSYRLDELREYVEEHYDVIYTSKQSYYDVLHEAHMGVGQ